MLRVTQERLAEKDFVRTSGVEVTDYARIESWPIWRGAASSWARRAEDGAAGL